MRLERTMILGLLALGGCVAPREALPAPAPMQPAPPPPPPAPPPPADWRDLPRTAGTWRYVPGPASEARYGVEGGQIELRMRCDAGARRIRFIRTAAAPAGQVEMVVTTDSGVRRYPTQATGAGYAADVAANDSFLDVIAFSRGRFLVVVGGTPQLVLPAWAEISRVIEDCRG